MKEGSPVHWALDLVSDFVGTILQTGTPALFPLCGYQGHTHIQTLLGIKVQVLNNFSHPPTCH